MARIAGQYARAAGHTGGLTTGRLWFLLFLLVNPLMLTPPLVWVRRQRACATPKLRTVSVACEQHLPSPSRPTQPG